jgi:hypothetical protein
MTPRPVLKTTKDEAKCQIHGNGMSDHKNKKETKNIERE